MDSHFSPKMCPESLDVGQRCAAGRGGAGGEAQPHLVGLPTSGNSSVFSLQVCLAGCWCSWLAGCFGTKWTGLELPQH